MPGRLLNDGALPLIEEVRSMFLLSSVYKPITAESSVYRKAYFEAEPCEELKPYIRCFWGTPKPHKKVGESKNTGVLVIPDTCMDIIFNVNYTQNTIDSGFCAIHERAFLSPEIPQTDAVSTFAIRFYPWGAALFSDEALNGSKNRYVDLEMYFNSIKRQLEPFLFETDSISERIKIAERILIEHKNQKRQNDYVMNALYQMISSRGTIKIADICSCTSVSNKHLERLFNEYIGISPKGLQSLIRYQLLWKDILKSKNFNALDAVDKYGYFDQAHLINDFKKHHLMTPEKAKRFLVE